MTFERVKVGIAVPTAGLIRAACVFSLMQVVGKLAQTRLWPEAKEQGLTILMREGSGIGPNREKMVEEAIANDCTHVCFVDDDMSFEPEAFMSLCRRRLPIVGCNYRMKFPPAQFTAVHLEKERGRMETTRESTGLEPVCYMGFGLSLIETRVFQASRSRTSSTVTSTASTRRKTCRSTGRPRKRGSSPTATRTPAS